MDNMITIKVFEDIFEAKLAIGLLQESGITCELLNERTLSMIPGIASSRIALELQVLASEAERALELLDEVEVEDDVSLMLKDEKAILEGHFLLTSGRHSGSYVEKIRVLQNPRVAKLLCQKMARKLDHTSFDCVVGPAYGGIALAFEVASLMEKSFVFCQRKDGEMTIRSGFDLEQIHRAVIVEDIITTGGSVNEVMQCLIGKGIEVAAVTALVDRSGGKVDFGVPLHSLLQLNIPTWESSECPLCLEGVPLTKPGSSDKTSK